MASAHFDAIVAGAGPAGVAVALRLRALGLKVALAARPRRGGIEGLSERSLALLAGERLERAAAQVSGPCERIGQWGAGNPVRGREWLVGRAGFDAALLADAAAGGVPLLPAVSAIADGPDGVELDCADGLVRRARCLVDARGRHRGGAAGTGPRLSSLAWHLRVALPAGTHLLPWADGWCWGAADGRGTLYLQLITTPGELRRTGSAGLLRQAAAALPKLAAWLAQAQPDGTPAVCAATARAAAADSGNIVRTGDALVAPDPLSGQGIYWALAGAAGTAAAVYARLDGGDIAAAREFQRERAQELWHGTLSAAASHYASNAEAVGGPFWSEAARRYRQLAASAAPAVAASAPRFALRPVLNGARIERRRVLLTPERPRGLWHYRSVDLASLADALAQTPAAGIGELAQRLQRPPADVAAAARLLQRPALSTTNAGDHREHAHAA